MSESNASLARRASHDALALAQLLRRHETSVFKVCMRLMGHQQDAEDVAQETMVRATKYIDRFDPGKPFGPWLLSIAGNRCRSLLARRSRMPATAVLWEPACERGLREADANQLQEEVTRAIEQLPAKQRQAFEMFHQEGMDYREIADRLDCPIGTVKTWVHRARLRLFDELREREVIEGLPSGRGKERRR